MTPTRRGLSVGINAFFSTPGHLSDNDGASPAVSILKEQGRWGTQRFGAGNQCLYCPFWTRGPLDDTPTQRNPVALEWQKS